MPEKTLKPRNMARMKTDPFNTYGGMGMGGILALVSSLMYSRNSGQNFAIRQEMARMNREGIDAE